MSAAAKGGIDINSVPLAPDQCIDTFLKQYSLVVNNGKNALHGGPTGLHAQVWDAYQTGSQNLTLNTILPYGHEGFSGEVKISVEYTWTDDNELILEYFEQLIAGKGAVRATLKKYLA